MGRHPYSFVCLLVLAHTQYHDVLFFILGICLSRLNCDQIEWIIKIAWPGVNSWSCNVVVKCTTNSGSIVWRQQKARRFCGRHHPASVTRGDRDPVSESLSTRHGVASDRYLIDVELLCRICEYWIKAVKGTGFNLLSCKILTIMRVICTSQINNV